MTISLSDDQVCLLRMRAQRLVPGQPDTATSAAHVVKEVCGIQAQDTSAATLAIRVRSAGLVATDVEHARIQQRTIIRIAGGQRRRAELGLDEDTCARGIHIIRNVLANLGPLTRAELVEQLAFHGIQLVGQARPYLLQRAALEGIICFGPDRGAEPTYVLLSDWIGQEHREQALSEVAAHTELTRRYLKVYGPATPKDQAAWSGMPLSKIRAAWQHIADQLIEVEVAGSPSWMLKSCAAWLDEPLEHAPIVRLLPHFDTYLLGYQGRDLSVPPQYAKRINAGGGMLHPTVLVDGRVMGTWKSKRQKNHLDVLVEPFDPLTPEVLAGLETEVTDLARFLEVQATLK